jgi:hypothetical protein
MLPTEKLIGEKLRYLVELILNFELNSDSNSGYIC